MRFEKVWFPNSSGEQLGARLDLPAAGEPVACALFAHCFACTKNLRAVGDITRALAQHGIATLRFDFTGLGESEGDFAGTDFSSNVDDVVAAAQWMAANLRPPAILIGHSLGGAAALKAAPALPDVASVVTIGAPASPDHVVRHIRGEGDEIASRGEGEVLLAGRPFNVGRQFLDDIATTRMTEAIAAVRRPLLVLHSPVDEIVGIDNAATIFEAARHPKSFVSLDHADHLLSDSSDSEYVGNVIASWASRYVATDLRDMAAPRRDGPSASTTVARTETGFRTEIIANGFALTADEPGTVGGTDAGPTPYDYLLAALGACTSMTLRMYADRKGLDLDAVKVTLGHDKIHARDCADCEAETGMVDRIERYIRLEGDLDDTERARLLEIADRCPVHKTLRSDVAVETRLDV